MKNTINKSNNINIASIINKAKTVFAKIPKNAFLFLITGFLFSVVMLLNVLHSKHPHGGWVTDMGMISTQSLLLISLAAMSISLIALWKAVDKIELTQQSVTMS